MTDVEDNATKNRLLATPFGSPPLRSGSPLSVANNGAPATVPPPGFVLLVSATGMPVLWRVLGKGRGLCLTSLRFEWRCQISSLQIKGCYLYIRATRLCKGYPNRQVRFRMLGGVGGVRRSDPPPLSRSSPAPPGRPPEDCKRSAQRTERAKTG